MKAGDRVWIVPAAAYIGCAIEEADVLGVNTDGSIIAKERDRFSRRLLPGEWCDSLGSAQARWHERREVQLRRLAREIVSLANTLAPKVRLFDKPKKQGTA